MSSSTLMSLSTGGATSIFGGLGGSGGPVEPPKGTIPTANSAAVEQAKEDERQRLRGLQGRRSTQVAGLLTGDAPVQKKTLLGQ